MYQGTIHGDCPRRYVVAGNAGLVSATYKRLGGGWRALNALWVKV